MTFLRSLVAALPLVLVAACAAAPDSASTEESATLPPLPQGTPIDGFPGSKIYKPAVTPAPAVVMLHGSEGGSATYIDGFAQEIAQSGFVVVTMCWFGCPGKPATIEDIPLESIVAMGNWAKASPVVKDGRVGLFGWSRGAELALLVTSLAGTEPFQAVAVHAPSDTIVSAFDPATENDPPSYGGILEPDAQGNMIPAPSWTWQGRELFGEPKPDFSVPGPLIAVTSYANPVYVSQGMNDEVWPVTRGQHVVAERNAVSGLVTESHFYPGEGHVLQKPGDILTMDREVASFFQRHL